MTTKQKTLLAVAGCGGSLLLSLCCGAGTFGVWHMTAKPTIVGKWNGPHGDFLQFNNDGSVINGGPGMGIKGEGGVGFKAKYRLIDKTHFEVEDFSGHKEKLRFLITDDRLQIEDEGNKGRITIYDRAK